MPTTPPRWYELVIGAGMLTSAVWLGWHLIHHPDHEHLYAWGFVASLGLVGLWLVAPVRAATIWREVRTLLPWGHHDRRPDP